MIKVILYHQVGQSVEYVSKTGKKSIGRIKGYNNGTKKARVVFKPAPIDKEGHSWKEHPGMEVEYAKITIVPKT